MGNLFDHVIRFAGGAGYHRGMGVCTVGLNTFIDHPVVALAIVPLPFAAGNEVGVEVDDGLAGAVVDVEGDLADGGIKPGSHPLRELHEIFYGGPSKAVQGLVVIAHHTEVALTGGQFEEQLLLNRVGVLVLVDDDVFEDVVRVGGAVQGV